MIEKINVVGISKKINLYNIYFLLIWFFYKDNSQTVLDKTIVIFDKK